ncbi:MAG: vitamin K epoxide reductase family protein [Ketobacteraceae bacterium]|nr:vitamin K epoxide reductase family protein [Ketobacteraceae bacterium]
MAKSKDKPLVLITGSAGKLGTSLTSALKNDYTVVGLDVEGTDCDIEFDVTSADSVELALTKVGEKHGKEMAAVIHLAAYFDFSGEESPLYKAVNEKGTENLLKELQQFKVDRFIYTSTMLVNEPVSPGELIDESAPVAPKWAYPKSKARTEEVIKEHHGKIPYTLLRLAGVYDEETAVPTLSHQIARIYEASAKSYLYAGDTSAGQAFIHHLDMVDLIRRTVNRRKDLPDEDIMVAGEQDVLSYQDLQEEIGCLIHGEEKWHTIRVPKPVAKAGAWVEDEIRPRLPDEVDDQGAPFIKPFMVDMASDHYALNISRAQKALDWQPERSLRHTLKDLVAALKKDPVAWYEANGVTLPSWLRAASDKTNNAEKLRHNHEQKYQAEHRRNLWAPFLNMGLGAWLMASPMSLGYESTYLWWSDIICGALIIALSFVALSDKPMIRLVRWPIGAIGLWLMTAPLLFWAPTAASYTNGTLTGALVFSLALVVRPFPGISPVADVSGPDVPPGWEFSPSDWIQRIPIIFLAFIGFIISHYLAAYQLGHIDAVWEPFFKGANPGDAKNGTEEIITSRVSEAWPVPDAGLGALTYMLEILTGLIGSRARWRTMPWLVLLFGFMIVPLGAVSITFIIIQPIILDTWCTLCLVAAAAMLIQIPYSFDEIVATIGFLKRRHQAGMPWVKVLFTGDTDEANQFDYDADNFQRPASTVIKDMITGGITVPWNLALCGAIGVWLMCTRLTLGSSGDMANADHLIGSFVLTITVTACAEVMRALRFINVFLGMALLITPFVFTSSPVALVMSVICGVALISLSMPSGKIQGHYGRWDKVII